MVAKDVGEAEVGQFTQEGKFVLGVGKEQEVGRFEVAMDDAAGVGVGQSIEDLLEEQPEGWPVVDERLVGEGAQRGQFHGHEMGVGGDGEVVTGEIVGDLAVVKEVGDVGVAKGGVGLDLATEVGLAIGLDIGAVEKLDGHGKFGAPMLAGDDDAHATAAEDSIEVNGA